MYLIQATLINKQTTLPLLSTSIYFSTLMSLFYPLKIKPKQMFSLLCQQTHFCLFLFSYPLSTLLCSQIKPFCNPPLWLSLFPQVQRNWLQKMDLSTGDYRLRMIVQTQVRRNHSVQEPEATALNPKALCVWSWVCLRNLSFYSQKEFGHFGILFSTSSFPLPSLFLTNLES